MSSAIHNFLVLLESSKYLIVFILAILEGPILMLTSGFLYRIGQFSILPLYIALLAGDLVADFGWYALGRFGGRPLLNKMEKFLKITPAMIEKVQERFHKYHGKILFISKITMGFGFALATLIVAGILHVPFKKYALLNFLGGLIWTAFLLILGYFLGGAYYTLFGAARIIFVIAFITLAFFAFKFANKILLKAKI